MEKLEIKAIFLGVIDIVVGLCLLSTLIFLQGPSFPFILGILYLIFGYRILKHVCKFKLLFYGIIPLTILSSFMVIMLGIDKNVPEYYRISIIGQIISISILSSVCFINVYFFTRSNIKDTFMG